MIQLRKVDIQNVWNILALSVSDNQKSFVATNTESIVEAYCAITGGGVALPFGIYEEDTLVGFTMISYGCDDWEDAPAIARDNYAIWRLMIDQRFQGKGYGKAAMAAILDFIRTFPRGKAEYCMLSYEPENTVAKALYHSFGFRENGEMDGDEIVAVLKL